MTDPPNAALAVEQCDREAISDGEIYSLASFGGDREARAKFVSEMLQSPKEYRGWVITWDYGEYTATGPDYDASYEGPEDGWVDNGHRVSARTLGDALEEIDSWFEERGDDA